MLLTADISPVLCVLSLKGFVSLEQNAHWGEKRPELCGETLGEHSGFSGYKCRVAGSQGSLCAEAQRLGFCQQ